MDFDAKGIKWKVKIWSFRWSTIRFKKFLAITVKIAAKKASENRILWPSVDYKAQSFFVVRTTTTCMLNCPSSKGNHAPTQKFERPNEKNTKPKNFLKSVQNLCPFLTWKLYEANSSKIWIESKQIKTNENQWRFWLFYI